MPVTRSATLLCLLFTTVFAQALAPVEGVFHVEPAMAATFVIQSRYILCFFFQEKLLELLFAPGRGWLVLVLTFQKIYVY